MQVRILGCSGGISGGLRTTSILIDNDVLIDCGTGVGDLSLEELGSIKHIFLTHGHLDHIAFIPLLVDSAFDALVSGPVTIHLQVETLEMLRQHIFNWQIWPDFSRQEFHEILNDFQKRDRRFGKVKCSTSNDGSQP